MRCLGLGDGLKRVRRLRLRRLSGRGLRRRRRLGWRLLAASKGNCGSEALQTNQSDDQARGPEKIHENLFPFHRTQGSGTRPCHPAFPMRISLLHVGAQLDESLILADLGRWLNVTSSHRWDMGGTEEVSRNFWYPKEQAVAHRGFPPGRAPFRRSKTLAGQNPPARRCSLCGRETGWIPVCCGGDFPVSGVRLLAAADQESGDLQPARRA